MHFKKRPDSFYRKQQWHLWFAWWPTVVKNADESEHWIWLQWLVRRMTDKPRWCPDGLRYQDLIWEYAVPVLYPEDDNRYTYRLPDECKAGWAED